MDIATTEPGTRLFNQRIPISQQAVDAYLAAVEDGNTLYTAEGLAPPMAVAALVMAQALKAIDLPPGSVHTGQELEFSAPVLTGTEVTCTAIVAQNSVRRGTRFVTLDIVGEVDGRCAIAGKVSLAIPEAQGGA